MKHEFKVKKLQDETVYTLESATGGGTSAGAIASVSTPVGGVQRRASLVTSEEKKDAPKPRNFVAKNAKMGGAGQHKDKKKAEKQGDVKHKKPYMESLKGRIEELKSKLDEVSLGDYRKKATMQKAQSQMGAMFAKDPEEREKNVSTFQKRERGLNRLKARDEKSRADAQTKQSADLVARLPELKAEYEKMRAEYKSLGGSNWQYADREQNLTDYERKARSMEGPMNNLWRQIQAAEKAQGEQGVAEDAHGSEHFMDIIDATNGDVRGIMQELRSSGLHSEIIKFCQWAREQGIADIFDAIKLAKRVGLENDDENEFAYEGYLRAMELLGQQGVAEGTNDTIYPNAEVIKSKNGKPVGEIYQDGNSWGAFHYKADRGYDFIDSREEAIEALKDLHQETGRSRPDYTVKGVAEGLPQTLRKVVPGHAKREIDKKMDAGKFGKTDADKDANFQRYKKIQDKLKEQGVAEGSQIERKISRTQALIQDYYNRARASKNDIKRDHYIDMARQLEYELEGMINDANEQERDSNMVSQHDATPSATWNRGGLKEQGVAEGSYDDDKGITHTRGSLVAKLEALPKGSDDFEWNRIQAIHHLKQGNMLRAKYYMALMKRGEQGVAEGDFTISDDPSANAKLLFLKTINGNEYRLVKQGNDVYKIYVNRSTKNKQVFPSFDLAKKALQQLLLNAVHTDEQGVAEAAPGWLRHTAGAATGALAGVGASFPGAAVAGPVGGAVAGAYGAKSGYELGAKAADWVYDKVTGKRVPADSEVDEELTMKHQRDHHTQRRPDISNSLADRGFDMSEKPNVTKSADGHPTVKWRHHGHAGHTRVEPTLNPTTVQRKDTRPIPSWLKKEQEVDEAGMLGFMQPEPGKPEAKKPKLTLSQIRDLSKQEDERSAQYVRSNDLPRNPDHMRVVHDDVELGELSNELLDRYKKELGVRATAADRAGDYDQGHEYFKKINRATIRQGENDARRHAEKENDMMETRLNMMRKAGYDL